MVVLIQSKALATDEQRAELEKLFSNLSQQAANKLPQQAADTIPYKQLIPGIVRQLMLMTPSRVAQDPRNKKRLKQIALSIADMVELIGDLPVSDIDDYDYLLVALRGLKGDLRAIQTALELTLQKRVKAKAHKGGPKNLQAIKIARIVTGHYLGLTGKEPKRNNRNDNAKSPSQEFLAAVYETLGVKANAEHYLRLVEKEKQSCKQADGGEKSKNRKK